MQAVPDQARMASASPVVPQWYSGEAICGQSFIGLTKFCNKSKQEPQAASASLQMNQ